MTAELDPTRESVWTSEDLITIRAGLVAAAARLTGEIAVMGSDMTQAASKSTIEILHDELDVASQRSELLQDAVQAENAAAILAQTEHVLTRLDAGLYGSCEQCSGPIGRDRLEAFPRATLCMTCVG